MAKEKNKTKIETIDINKKTKKVSKKQSTNKTKATANKNKKATTNQKSVKKTSSQILEYYDLPYRYNQTIIKLLAQTPKTLFVYWDISDEDQKNLVSKFGDNFFEKTKPVLIVNNLTKNYSFEVEINDFANSWYLNVADSDCIYKIELGRKYISNNNSTEKDYINITSSNNLKSPNDHILFNTQKTVIFKNIKNNKIEEKKINDLNTIKNINKIYNIYDIYKEIYLDEDIQNPLSSSSSN